MQIYNIANPEELLGVNLKLLRAELAEACSSYAGLCSNYDRAPFLDSVRSAASSAADTPSVRAWIQLVRQTRLFCAGDEPVPNAGHVGYLRMDSPDVGRYVELIGWQLIGAACESNTAQHWRLPAAPPGVLSLGSLGSFRVGEHWPTSGIWELQVDGGEATLTGPGFAATSNEGDPGWMTPIRASAAESGFDVVVPLHDASLMNRDLQSFPMIRSRQVALRWASALASGARTIRSYSPQAAHCAEKFLAAAVPLLCGKEVIGSASVEEILGLAFLPATDQQDQLVECLLHEVLHQYLFRIEACGSLFTDVTTSKESFYSPWRSDPRPLRMCMHGAYVFSAVADMYTWEGAPDNLGISERECHRRAYLRARQVRIAVDLVRLNAELTKIGEAVIVATEECIREVMERVSTTADDHDEVEMILSHHAEKYAPTDC